MNNIYEVFMIVMIINAVLVAFMTEGYSYIKEQDDAQLARQERLSGSVDTQALHTLRSRGDPSAITGRPRVTFWEFVFRTTAWVGATGAFALLLGFEVSFKLFLLCIFSGLADGLIWFAGRKNK